MEILVTAGYIALCIVLFSVAIAIHEFGHFIVALKLGLNVERFSIGFGPVICNKTWRGVEYRLSWIPLGGYVSIPDVDPEGTKAIEGGTSGDAPKKRIAPWKEIAVAFAGPAMNLFLAVFLAVVLALVPSARFGEGQPVLDDLSAIGPAECAGMKRGDRIVAVDGRPVSTWIEIMTEVQLSDGRPVEVKALRGGEEMTFTVTPQKNRHLDSWGIGASAALTTEIGEVEKGGAADEAGVKPLDRIVAVNGEPVSVWSDVLDSKALGKGEESDLVLERGGTNLTVRIKPRGRFAYQVCGPFGAPAVVSLVGPGTVAARAGVKDGDRVVSLGGRDVADWDGMREAVQATGGAESDLVVERDGEIVKLRVAPEFNAETRRYYLQLAMDAEAPARLYVVKGGSEAEKAGFMSGDEIVKVGGTSVSTWRQAEVAIHNAGTATNVVSVTVRRGGETKTVETPLRRRCVSRAFGIGLAPIDCAAWMSRRSVAGQLASDAGSIFRLLKALVTPKQAKATGKALGGPVMIAMGIYTSVRHDFWSGLGFLRFLNVNLAILNLLPIPVLDGGLIMFALIALVFRRRVPDRIVGAVSMGFMYAILAAMAFLVYRDVGRGVGLHRRNAESINFIMLDHALENADEGAEAR